MATINQCEKCDFSCKNNNYKQETSILDDSSKCLTCYSFKGVNIINSIKDVFMFLGMKSSNILRAVFVFCRDF